MHHISNSIRLSDNSQISIHEICNTNNINVKYPIYKKPHAISNNIYTKTSILHKKYKLKYIENHGCVLVYKVKFSHDDTEYIFDNQQTFQVITENELFWLPINKLYYRDYNILGFNLNSSVIISKIVKFEEYKKQEVWKLKFDYCNSTHYYMLDNGIVTKDSLYD